MTKVKNDQKARAKRQQEIAKEQQKLFDQQVKRNQQRVADSEATKSLEDSPNDLRVSGLVKQTTPRTKR